MGEKGFTFIELIIVAGVTVLVAGAASIASMQIFKQSELHSNHMTAVEQVQNALRVGRKLKCWVQPDQESMKAGRN